MNKELEFFYLEKFKENYSDFPSGIVCLDEKPDFLIKAEGKLLGIEITDFYRGKSSKIKSPLQQKLAIRQKIR